MALHLPHIFVANNYMTYLCRRITRISTEFLQRSEVSDYTNFHEEKLMKSLYKFV